jgi:hypothetical protein
MNADIGEWGEVTSSLPYHQLFAGMLGHSGAMQQGQQDREADSKAKR